MIAKAVAVELALEHCRFYGDKTPKVVKVFFSLSLPEPRANAAEIEPQKEGLYSDPFDAR